jgi:excisionase family DNA binding protein
MLTTTQAAEILNLSTRRIIALVRSGLLVGQKHGRDWMISEDSVKARTKDTPGAGRPKKL